MGMETGPRAGRNVMGDTFSLGRIAGIRVGVNWSVLLIVALLAYGLAVGEFPAAAPHHPVVEYLSLIHI